MTEMESLCTRKQQCQYFPPSKMQQRMKANESGSKYRGDEGERLAGCDSLKRFTDQYYFTSSSNIKIPKLLALIDYKMRNSNTQMVTFCQTKKGGFTPSIFPKRKEKKRQKHHLKMIQYACQQRSKQIKEKLKSHLQNYRTNGKREIKNIYIKREK